MNLSLITLATAGLLFVSTAATAAGDRELSLRTLDVGVASTPEALAGALLQAPVLASRTLTGSEAEIAYAEIATDDTGRYEVDLAPGADAQHRRLSLRYRTDGHDDAGHPTRKTVSTRPREIETGQATLIVLPTDSHYAIEVCTGKIGDCAEPAAKVSER